MKAEYELSLPTRIVGTTCFHRWHTPTGNQHRSRITPLPYSPIYPCQRQTARSKPWYAIKSSYTSALIIQKKKHLGLACAHTQLHLFETGGGLVAMPANSDTSSTPPPTLSESAGARSRSAGRGNVAGTRRRGCVRPGGAALQLPVLQPRGPRQSAGTSWRCSALSKTGC